MAGYQLSIQNYGRFKPSYCNFHLHNTLNSKKCVERVGNNRNSRALTPCLSPSEVNVVDDDCNALRRLQRPVQSSKPAHCIRSCPDTLGHSVNSTHCDDASTWRECLGLVIPRPNKKARRQDQIGTHVARRRRRRRRRSLQELAFAYTSLELTIRDYEKKMRGLSRPVCTCTKIGYRVLVC